MKNDTEKMPIECEKQQIKSFQDFKRLRQNYYNSFNKLTK